MGQDARADARASQAIDAFKDSLGSRDGNTALESLLTALAAAGLITDDTTP